MLIQGSVCQNMSVGSIRSTGRIGRCHSLVINPHNLHIDALRCRIVGEHGDQLISPTDIRDLGPRGVIIDDHDRLISPEDAVRLQPIMKINFSLPGLKAYVGRKHVGAVTDFAVDRDSLFIMKVYVQPTLFGRLKTDQLVFGRQQVEQVTKTKIVFTDSSKAKASDLRALSKAGALAQPSFNASLIEE